ncbi:MAG: Uma2 family endonuclease [Synechococcales bacterium]|nr:Uma2 family endonuclease [Synechococcales bacterium]
MTIAPSTQSQHSAPFESLEAYLAADPANLPEGRYEYWDGALVEIMPESLFHDGLANYLLILLVQAGIPLDLIRPHSCEVVVSGRPRTRLPDLTILEEVHLTLTAKRLTITEEMPPPRLVVEIVSPGKEGSANYKRDYQTKPQQYAQRGIPEMWQIDPDRAWVRVGQLVDGNYQFVIFQGQETIASPNFPGLTLTAAQVLRQEMDT